MANDKQFFDGLGNLVTFATTETGGRNFLNVTDATGAAATTPSYNTPALLISGTPTKFAINKSTSGSSAISGGTASQVIRVYALRLNTTADVDIIFQSASTTISETFYMRAGNYSREMFLNGLPLFQTATAEDLNWSLSANVAVSGFIYLVKS